MTAPARPAFWARTKKLTGALLLVWLGVNLLVPWYARDLNALLVFGFPLGYWLAAEGSLLVYLLIIVVYAVAMDRLEARCLADGDRDEDDAAARQGSGPA